MNVDLNILEIVGTVHIIDVMNRLVQMIGRISYLLQFPRWILINCCPLCGTLLSLDIKTDILQQQQQNFVYIYNDKRTGSDGLPHEIYYHRSMLQNILDVLVVR